MLALFLLAALGGVVYLMFWMIQNDGVKQIQDQKGILRMALPKGVVAVSEENPKTAKRRSLVTPPPHRPQDHRLLGPPPPKPVMGGKTVTTAPEETIIHPLHRGRHPRHRP